MRLTDQLHAEIESLQDQISQLQLAAQASEDIKGQAKINLLKMRLIYLRQAEEQEHSLSRMF